MGYGYDGHTAFDFWWSWCMLPGGEYGHWEQNMAIEQFRTIPTYVRHKKEMRKGDESMKKAPLAEGHNSKSIHPFTSIDRSIEREEDLWRTNPDSSEISDIWSES